MLFSPPNEFDKHFLLKVVGITGAVHLILLVTFFVAETLFGVQPLIFSLKSVGSPVSMGSKRRTSTKGRRQTTAKKTQSAPAKKKAKPVPKKKAKKAVKQPNKKDIKKDVTKKTPPKPEKKQAPKKEPEKKIESKEAEHFEVAVAQAALSSDAVVQEFARHFTLPPGFDETEPFTVTFDIKVGKVVNISRHGRESLVVYTAVKDALLKSTMPRRNSINVTMKIV